MRRIAYLFPAFPVLHQTFTLGEVLGLKRKGCDLHLVSLKRSDAGLQQSKARPLIAETDYCPALLSKQMLGSFLAALRRRPAGVGRLFATVFAAWRERRSESKPETAPPSESTLTPYERVLGVLHHDPYLYLLKSLLLVPYAIWIAERLNSRDVGHVHAHWATYPATVALLIKEWAGIPYSFTAHAYDIYMISRMLPTKIENAEFVVTCAQANRRYLTSLCGEEAAGRVHVNYHGTDLGTFRPGQVERGRQYRVMSCGWLKEYKGFHYLLDALALLVERGIDAHLDLAGDGPQKAHLEARSRSLGIADRITFHGYIGHEELVELYRASHVFALPSIVMGSYGRQDVIPNVLAEAMAVGIAVVGSDIGGVSELIEHDTDGLLVGERDTVALADALERLWREPDTAARLAESGRRKVERIWDRDRNLDELLELFDRYVGEQPSGMAA